MQPYLDELVKVIYQMGEYRLSADYNHLEVDPLQWTQMTSHQRDAKIKKVFSCILPSRKRDEAITRKLSIGLVECQLSLQFPSYELKDIWRRAEIILSHYKIIELLRHRIRYQLRNRNKEREDIVRQDLQIFS